MNNAKMRHHVYIHIDINMVTLTLLYISQSIQIVSECSVYNVEYFLFPR